MIIGFDASQTGHLKMGCGNFADSLARELVRAAPDDQLVLYPTFGAGYWDATWPRSTLHLPGARRGPGQRRLDELEDFWLAPPSDLEARLGSPDVVHSNNFFCPTTLKRAKLVYTLHDLAFAVHPEWTSEANWRTCLEGVVRASAYADHIVAVSEFTRAQFLEMFPHVSPDKVSVVYEASRFSGPRRSPPPGPVAHLRPGEFWLACGTDDARKNRPRLVQAYAKLRARGETSYPLVLFGGGKLEGDGVHQLGYVDDATLEWLYENCTAFVYPSLFEGFGLPVVEAMSLGAAVLTSNVASLPEVVGGDCALLVDPYDVDALYAELRKLATEPSVKDGLRHRGRERAKRFSWRRAAREVLEIYRQLTNEYAPDGERKALLGAAEHP